MNDPSRRGCFCPSSELSLRILGQTPTTGNAMKLSDEPYTPCSDLSEPAYARWLRSPMARERAPGQAAAFALCSACPPVLGRV
ncbi:MAG TPA: hypothetical protein VME42_04585 [Steroidobacteraceae bacterium]|nr:hypothetical protein [Steroidobacteraceae bacterium]